MPRPVCAGSRHGAQASRNAGNRSPSQSRLTDKTEKAKAREAAKRAAGDELKAVVGSLVTDEPQTADEIAAQIEGEDVTRAKVIARLSQLIKDGKVAKEQRREEKRKYMVYFLAQPEAQDAE